MEHAITYHQVSCETFTAVDQLFEIHSEKLEAYLDQLLWWNERINLVSRDVPRETVREHLRHSLLSACLDCFNKSEIVVDAGTGGGLPGVPLAIVAPEKSFILNDIVSKKQLAVKQIVKTLGLHNVSTYDRSIEHLEVANPFLLVTKHAFKIHDLVQMTKEKPWTKIIFYKGMNFEEELKGTGPHLSIRTFDLYGVNQNDFYRDKALLEVSRNTPSDT